MMSATSGRLNGVDVGGTNLRIGVVDALQVVAERRVQADFSGICRAHEPAEALRRIIEHLSSALTETLQQYPECVAIGIGFPGFVDPVNGRVSQSPNLPGLRDIDLVTPLQQALGCPVMIENDALAAAFGEYRLLGESARSLVYLGLGTGVGGGLILSGTPYQGDHGVAMEVGHIVVEPGGRPCGCGNLGCMEQYASASGVCKTYAELRGKTATADQVAALASAGDAAATAALQSAGEYLAFALAHILKTVDVSHVVIGGGMSAAWPLMAAAFTQRLAADLIPALRGRVSVSLSQSGDQAGMLGAAWLAGRAIQLSD